jgi:light-regulated signal transduction histidine kinase (bacteriophytochrome)
LFEVLLISSALADRINLLRIGHERERHERVRLVEQQNAWLEENVKIRTQELFSKSLEVESQNEELKQQHEELSATHEIVEKQKALVEEQNRKIEDINYALEKMVQERTLQLEDTVKSLIRQNHDLEQFSYIVSHNMRAPVARILGLLNLLEFESSSEGERRDIIAFLKESAYGVDQIIHDLSQIIAIRKGLDTVMEKVDIGHVLRHNQSDLTDEINKASAQIIQKVEVNEIFSVRGYVQSILYNLLSNAIKYRDPERKSIITISVYERDNRIVFEVADNGLGINLPPERMNEIFHLYKRLHTHVQGKGLGLYLVKSQVEGLHGTIQVQTALGKGTTFIVSIPKN